MFPFLLLCGKRIKETNKDLRTNYPAADNKYFCAVTVDLLTVQTVKIE